MSTSSTLRRKAQLELELNTTSSDGASAARAKPSSTITATRQKSSARQSAQADSALQEVLNRLSQSREYCLDVETSGLDWKRNAIVGYVLSFSGDPRDSYYIPFRHAGDGNVGGREGLRTATSWDGKLAPGEAMLVKAMDKQGALMFGHKIAFDLKFLHRVGFTLKPRFEDTALTDTLFDEFAGSYDLEDCAHRHKVQAKKKGEIVAYLRSKFSEIKSDKDAMGHYWRLRGDDKVGVEYARGDGTTTWQLRDKQAPLITKQETWRNGRGREEEVPTLELVHDVESRLIPVLVRMMVKGIKIDPDRLDWMDGEIDQRLKTLYSAFPAEFNARSPKDVKAWMEQHGQTDWPSTAPSRKFPHGQPSFKGDWLKKSDAGNKIVDVRKYETLKSTFAEPLRNEHMFRGRVHTTFNQLKFDDYGTVTGRLSSTDPNMQAVPKHDETTGRLFRSVFVPDQGKIWGAVDYSQAEPRLLAWYTRCKVLLDDYRNNPKADAHMAVTKAINAGKNLSDAELKKYRNDYGKRANQLMITGGGVKTMSEKYNIPIVEAERIWRDYFRSMPEIQPFQKAAARKFRSRGFMFSLLGRRMRLNDDRDYTAANRLLQGGNADIIKLKLMEVGEYLESLGGEKSGVDLLLNCHDAVDFQLHPDARSVYDECLRIMQDFSSEDAVIKLDLPMPVDAGEGPRWDIATYGEE